jgi:hypothetical protein
VRKQRDAPSGFEIPFLARVVETGMGDDGDAITGVVIDWQPTQAAQASDTQQWSKSLLLLRRVLTTTLASSGQTVSPFMDGPAVCACDLESVREEFYRQHPAEGTNEQKSEARRKAFNRALKTAQANGLIAVREVNGVQLVWLFKPNGT